ncbi:DUF2930 domain-containing protein, partial [Cephalotus follicularis]
MSSFFFNGFIQLPIPSKFSAKSSKSFSPISARQYNSQITTSRQQQPLNLSVIRFTLGIPGFDESYLPRFIGYGFGSLLVLNHFFGSNFNATTPAQMRTEALGLSLAAFSIALPYLGKFLKGATPVDQKTIPEDTEQIFVISQSVSDTLKEDLAWATYILLRNTNTTAVLMSIGRHLCVRGYWNAPNDVTEDQVLNWFGKQIGIFGLSDLKDSVYFPQSPDSDLWEMLPKGTRSLLIQPILHAANSKDKEMEKIEGFVMLASSMGYAYSNHDRSWIRAVANKFRGKN